MHALPDPSQLLTGALAFLRVSAILFALPLFGDNSTPLRARLLLALALTVGMYPLLPRAWAPDLSADVIMIGCYVLRELLLGIVVGYVARIVFDAMLMASNVVAYQMGFGTSNLFLPDLNANADAFTFFHRMMVMLIFLSLGLHHIWIAAIADTFRLVPGGMALPHGQLAPLLVSVTAGIFATSLQLAAPILVALLFAMAALGLVARAVPQLNVFSMSFPISFSLGLFIYVATLPFFPEWMREQFLSEGDRLASAARLLVK